MSGVRIACGIIWAVITLICAAGAVGELMIGIPGGAILCLVIAAGSALYDFRVWTSRARLLALIVGFVSERPPSRR